MRLATITLSDGLKGPRHNRSVASRWWKACFATLSSLSTNGLHYTLTVWGSKHTRHQGHQEMQSRWV